MKMPSALSTWFMILFFLFEGLVALGVSFGGEMMEYLVGIFGLGAAFTLFLKR